MKRQADESSLIALIEYAWIILIMHGLLTSLLLMYLLKVITNTKNCIDMFISFTTNHD